MHPSFRYCLLIFIIQTQSVIAWSFTDDVYFTSQQQATQYMIIVANAGPSDRTVANLSQDNMHLSQRITAERELNLSQLGQRLHDAYSIDKALENQYRYTKTVDTRFQYNLSKSQLLQKISFNFNSASYHNVIIYFSGNTHPKTGSWIIADSSPPYDGMLAYQELIKAWKARQNITRPRHLFLIIEGSSGFVWARKCYNDVDFTDISIMTCGSQGQSCADTGIGGYFTYNLAEAWQINKTPHFINEESIEESQNVTLLGIPVLLNKMFGVPLAYDNYKQIRNAHNYFSYLVNP